METDLRTTLLRQCPELGLLLELIGNTDQEFWLVGGCLRDLLMKRPVNDIDLAATGDPTALARRWSRKVRARWFWLDRDRQQSRVLLKSALHVDFSPLRAATLTEDLRLRDFTVNSMALPCTPPEMLVDPFAGAADIAAQRLRPTSEQSFSDDPLRMLKGVRHAVTLGFDCPPDTIAAIRRQAGQLAGVSGERVRDELLKILSSAAPLTGVELLDAADLMAPLFGLEGQADGTTRRMPGTDFSLFLARLAPLEKQWPDLAGRCTMVGQFSDLQALYLLSRLLIELRAPALSVLLHDGLRLSRHQQRLVEALVALDGSLEPLVGALRKPMTERGAALAVERLNPYAFEKMLYIGRLDARLPEEMACRLYDFFLRCQRQGRVPDRISGRRLEKILGRGKGPLVGQWLSKIKEAEINGEISSDADAEEWLNKQINI